jgi:hypothetical protein
MKRYQKQIDDAFTYHNVTPEQAADLQKVREKVMELAQTIVDTCPEARETSTALTKLEEVMFHANAGISRHGGE